MKTLIQLLIDAVYEADTRGYKGKINVSPAFLDVKNYTKKEKTMGSLICSGRFFGYELHRDPSLQGYGITLNTEEK